MNYLKVHGVNNVGDKEIMLKKFARRKRNMNYLKVYGVNKNGDKEIIFGSIEKNALINQGVKTAMEQGYTISEIIELAQGHNQFIESRFTEKGMQNILERALR